MLNESDKIFNIILSALLFPIFFQESFIIFAWGANDPTLILLAKRLFLLLPILAFIACCWVTIASLLTVLFRNNRQHFIVTLFITWWDLGKSIFSFWGGIFKFAFVLINSFLGLLKIIIIGIWAILLDIIFLPFRLLTNAGRNILGSSVPWISVILTLFWCFIEAIIFTYITTPLVIDVFSNITGRQMTEYVVRIPLFIFLFFIVLGSYAVLSTFFTYIKSKNISYIVGIIVIEMIVVFVEVTFLYREFVDSLVPWLAQHSENFELGIFWTLVIACFVWLGIRSLSWFLFASYGTPTILQIIQGKGLQVSMEAKSSKIHFLNSFTNFVNALVRDADWVKAKGEEILNAFILPPLQVIAATINFCILLFTGKHLFDLPFKDTTGFTPSKIYSQSFKRKEKSVPTEPVRVMQQSNINTEQSEFQDSYNELKGKRY